MIVDVNLAKKKPTRVSVRAVVKQETQKVIHIQIPVKIANQPPAPPAVEQGRATTHVITHAEPPKAMPEPFVQEPAYALSVTQEKKPLASTISEQSEQPVQDEPPVELSTPSDEDEEAEPFFFFESRPAFEPSPEPSPEQPAPMPPPKDDFFDSEETELGFFDFDPDEIPASHIDEDYRISIERARDSAELEQMPSEAGPQDWFWDEDDFHSAKGIDGMLAFYQVDEDEDEDKYEDEAEPDFEEIPMSDAPLAEDTAPASVSGSNEHSEDELDAFFLEDDGFDAFVMFSDEPEEAVSDEGFISFADEGSAQEEVPDEHDISAQLSDTVIDEMQCDDAASDTQIDSFMLERLDDDYDILDLGALESFEPDDIGYGTAAAILQTDKPESSNGQDGVKGAKGNSLADEALSDADLETEQVDQSQVKYFTRNERGAQVETSREDATEIVCYNENSGKPSRYFGVKKGGNS